MNRRAAIMVVVLVVAVASLAGYFLWRHGGGGLVVEAGLRGHKLTVVLDTREGKPVTVEKICVDGACQARRIPVTGKTKIDLYLNRVVEAGSKHKVSIVTGEGRTYSLVVRAEPPPEPGLEVLDVFYLPDIGLRVLVVNNSTRAKVIVAATVNGVEADAISGPIIYPTGKPTDILVAYRGAVRTGNNTCILFLDNGAWIKLSFKA